MVQDSETPSLQTKVQCHALANAKYVKWHHYPTQRKKFRFYCNLMGSCLQDDLRLIPVKGNRP